MVKNKSAFTFIETLIVLFFSIAGILMLTIIPHRMFDAYSGYIVEAKHNMTFDSITSSVHTDLMSGERITLNESGFNIGQNKYDFSNNDLVKVGDGKEIKLNEIPIDYKVSNNFIEIQSVSTEDEAEYKEPLIHIRIPLAIDLSSARRRAN